MFDLLNIRSFRSEGSGYVVEEFDEQGRAVVRPVTDKQAEEIKPQWEVSHFDLARYFKWAQAKPEIPVPTTIPVALRAPAKSRP